uniref:Uncharacterized protein n=1 Tax=viral metagenome TaxID=1070528 RepID=A0A6M3KZI8_9ZZZZ
MRSAEQARLKRIQAYTRYRNNYFLSIIKEATNIEFWSDWNRNRLKNLRMMLEIDYKIPVNFLSAFIYYTTYKYMHWNKRGSYFENYVGFISNNRLVVEFANYLGSRSMLWRRKNSRWPIDWEDKWGVKTSVRGQKLGKHDKHVEHDIMSKKVGILINQIL